MYDADGTVLGELSYFVRARLGRAHCPLCTITHGRVRERPEWRSSAATLPVPFDTCHRDDMPTSVRDLGLALPVVVAEHDDGSLTVAATAADLEACAGSPDELVRLLARSW